MTNKNHLECTIHFTCLLYNFVVQTKVVFTYKVRTTSGEVAELCFHTCSAQWETVRVSCVLTWGETRFERGAGGPM